MIVGSRLLWEMKRLSWKKNKPDKNSAGGADATDCLIYGCSIQAASRIKEIGETWRDNLSARDETLWDSIEAQDKRQEQGIQYPT